MSIIPKEIYAIASAIRNMITEKTKKGKKDNAKKK